MRLIKRIFEGALDSHTELESFTLEKNEYLSVDIKGFYRYEHYGYYDDRTPKYINLLKNDFNDKKQFELDSAVKELKGSLSNEIKFILDNLGWGFDKSSICVVPRSKIRETYTASQLLFIRTIKDVINTHFITNSGFDGTDYILRKTNTRTTHLNKKGYGRDGDMPYKGISNDTCIFSNNIKGKNILLIDDLYTKTINVIEDMVQALLDHGARQVAVYAIGYTMLKNTMLNKVNKENIPTRVNYYASSYGKPFVPNDDIPDDDIPF
ncbi:hypothetical protein ACLSZR_00720 [Avibacterium avium]